MSRNLPLSVLVLALGLWSAAVAAQRRDVFVVSRDHPAILYSSGPTSNAVAALNRRLAEGAARLQYDPASGYLRSVLEALNVPVASQALVFSQTSFQAPRIRMTNPRAVYFNDTVSVGWVRGGDILEVAAHDPQRGVIFYQLEQKQTPKPQFSRNDSCLACHLSWETLGVPGLTVQSVHPLPNERAYVNGYTTIHGSPLEQRWGGWWVTGDAGGAKHMGNISVMWNDKGPQPPNPVHPLRSVEGLFDLKGFPSPHSDVVSMLVLAHQTHMTNLITRTGWEARLSLAEPSPDASLRVREAAGDLVDYMLFIDEAPLTGPIKGSSGFAEAFAAQGPSDSKGRSLRQFDLRRRLFRHPCSFMIYTEAFDALPAVAKETVYARMWEVLSGREKQAKYQGLSAADRQAIVQILRETKKDLPPYYR
jgi:hypothetical protein